MRAIYWAFCVLIGFPGKPNMIFIKNRCTCLIVFAKFFMINNET